MYQHVLDHSRNLSSVIDIDVDFTDRVTILVIGKNCLWIIRPKELLPVKNLQQMIFTASNEKTCQIENEACTMAISRAPPKATPSMAATEGFFPAEK